LGLIQTQTILLYHAHSICDTLTKFLIAKTGVNRVEVVGEYRRRVEVVSRFDFLVHCSDPVRVIDAMSKYGGQTPLVESTETTATFALSVGPLLCLEFASENNWGLSLICATGSESH